MWDHVKCQRPKGTNWEELNKGGKEGGIYRAVPTIITFLCQIIFELIVGFLFFEVGTCLLLLNLHHDPLHHLYL